jgi:hypothetical protein
MKFLYMRLPYWKILTPIIKWQHDRYCPVCLKARIRKDLANEMDNPSA